MNEPIFAHMKEQMTPSAQAQAALTVQLAQAASPRKTLQWGRYAAVAACAALLIAAYPLYQHFKPQPKLHDYTVVEGRVVECKVGHTTITESEIDDDRGDGIASAAGNEETGDQDMAMSPQELGEAMEEMGFTQEEAETYWAMGYRMTWAKWWKFVHQQSEVEGEDLFGALKAFSQKELAVNTGDLDRPAIREQPAQPGVSVYQDLMDYFGGTLPDWYGGAYIDRGGSLMVLLVSDKDPGDKSLELEVLEAVGRTAPVGFTVAKYSRNELDRLNKELLALMDGKGIPAGWGVKEDRNYIVLDLYETPTDDLLAALARLDPDGDAILVQVVEGATVTADGDIVVVVTPASKPMEPVEGVPEEDTGIDVSHVMPGGAYVSDGEEDLIADEPVDEIAHEPFVGGARPVENEPSATEEGRSVQTEEEE